MNVPKNYRTVAAMAEIIANHFRTYGFKCEEPRFMTGISTPGNRLSGWLVVEWKEEKPTGQAAFSQEQVTCRAKFYEEELEGRHVGELDDTAVPLYKPTIGEAEVAAARLEINYLHHGRGMNGYTRDALINVRTGQLTQLH